MPSRRRFTLPEIARALRGAGAVLAVGAFVTALVLTGRPHAAQASALGAKRTVSAARTPSGLALPDVSGSMRLFGLSATHRETAQTPAASRSLSRAPLHRWVRPNWGPLTSPFGYRWGRLHAGIDLAGPWGSPILAATDGCISYAGPMSGYGEVMQITDWDGTETVYGHMSSFIRTSGCVKAGQPIARVGMTGDATGPHLHFEVRVGGVPINPIPFLANRGLDI
jgi:murein DD-endopeptidase MepM/ murein hydrolase activator NlpD